MEMPTSGRRRLNVFVLAMLSLAVVISLRNLPMSACYGLTSLFYYLLAAVVFMIPYALISAELASGWPKSGGIYIWVREAMGERAGFFAIWMQWFHNMTWYPAMLSFVGAALAYLFQPAWVEHKGYLLSVILIGFWGITLLNFYGIKTSAWISTTCVIIGSIIPGVVLILFGIFWFFSGRPVETSLQAQDLLPHLTGSTNLAFLAGIFLALAGLEANANLAREVKNPQKNYPRAIFTAAGLALAILVLGSLAIALVIPKCHINLVSSLLESFHQFFEAFHLRWLSPVIFILTLLGALGELNAWTIAGVKGLYATTSHGLLPPFLHKVNARDVPVRLLLFQGAIVTIASLIFLYLPNISISYWALSALSAQMYILMYIFLFLAGLILRYRKPDVHRVYKVPGGLGGMWLCALVGLAASVFALVLSFFPPMGFEIGNLFAYEGLLIVAFLIIVAIPLAIFAAKKPHWRRDVLTGIREEIRTSTHST